MKNLQGFTLLEMLLVMTLAALVLTVVPASFSAMLPNVERQAEARELVSELRATRGRAIRDRQEMSLMLDLRRHQYRVLGTEKTMTLSEDIVLSFRPPFSSDESESFVTIHFFADGSSSGGVLEMTAVDAVYQVEIDWLTGRVRTREGAAQ